MITQELAGAIPLKGFLGRKPFYAYFRKSKDKQRDGIFDVKPRTMYRDSYGKIHRLQGGEQTTNPNEFLNVFDRRARGYRNIPVRKLRYLKLGSKRYTVEHIKKDSELFPIIAVTLQP